MSNQVIPDNNNKPSCNLQYQTQLFSLLVFSSVTVLVARLASHSGCSQKPWLDIAKKWTCCVKSQIMEIEKGYKVHRVRFLYAVYQFGLNQF